MGGGGGAAVPMGSTGSVREEYIVCPGKEGGVSVEMDGCPQETGEGA